MTWERAVIAAVWIACGYAALIGSLVALKALEDWSQARAAGSVVPQGNPLDWPGSNVAGQSVNSDRPTAPQQGGTA